MIGTMLPTVNIVAANIRWLLENRGPSGPRPEQAKRLDIGDKTLGFLKSGTGNPTLESLEKVAAFYRLEVWQLLVPNGPSLKAPPMPGSVAASLSERGGKFSEKLGMVEVSGSASPALYEALNAVLALALPPQSDSATHDDYAELRKALNNND